MTDLTAQRTLVKSPPELWSELSEVESLAKHLGELGEIRIVKVEPESTVAWEGEQVSGTVALEQSGWGTKVTFTATVPEPGPAVAATPPAEPEPAAPEPAAATPEPAETAVAVAEPAAPEPAETAVAVAEPAAPEPVEEVGPAPPASDQAEPRRRGFLARWLFRERSPSAPATEPEAEPVVAAEPVAIEPKPATVEPEPVAAQADVDDGFDAGRVQRVLDDTLDALGQAHHRPFSRG